MLTVIIDKLVYDLLGFEAGSRMGGAVHFFLYDSVKIILLLGAMITAIGVLRTFLPRRKVKYWLSRSGWLANLYASLFGAMTPFCSCSSIPLFMGFVEAGIPLGVTFSFLVTSPIVNEYLVILMLGFFGWKITLVYAACGIVIGVLSGLIIGRLKPEHYIVSEMISSRSQMIEEEEKYGGLRGRIIFGVSEARSIIRRLWKWVLVGVAIGAIIHNYVPQQAIESLISQTGVFSVPLAVILGVPLYGNCAAIVPIAVVLFQKGIPLGTALAFMMAISALSFPEAIILRRAMKLRLIALFFAVTTAGIIISGYLINALQALLTG